MNMQPTLERALSFAEGPVLASSPEPIHQAGSERLTPRERDVAALLSAGLSNRDIGEALVITEGTAEVHVKHILSKLGFRSRSQAAVWATEQGLVKPRPGDASDDGKSR
jgi:non-specific serine/threonine protein kinase